MHNATKEVKRALKLVSFKLFLKATKSSMYSKPSSLTNLLSSTNFQPSPLYHPRWATIICGLQWLTSQSAGAFMASLHLLPQKGKIPKCKQNQVTSKFKMLNQLYAIIKTESWEAHEIWPPCSNQHQFYSRYSGLSNHLLLLTPDTNACCGSYCLGVCMSAVHCAITVKCHMFKCHLWPQSKHHLIWDTYPVLL